ncbi:hypothetical protein ACWDUI_20395, partial [Streptosporangium sandarakinum]
TGSARPPPASAIRVNARHGMSHGRESGTSATLEVIIGAVVAWVLAGEALGFFQIAGGLVVLAGAYLAQRATDDLPQAAVETPEPARAG